MFIENDIFKTIIPLKYNTTPEVTPQDTPQVEREKEILEFCKVEKTRSDIQGFLNLKDRKYFSKYILKPLLEEGKLERTIPDKPSSPKQKYRAVKNK